jgi:hypothetical protein
MGRKPLLWDNYPVNDGPKMCKRPMGQTGRFASGSSSMDLPAGMVVGEQYGSLAVCRLRVLFERRDARP